MPCSDSSSSIALKLDDEERFVSFEFKKITCGKEITAHTDYTSLCRGKTLPEILDISFHEASDKLQAKSEEDQFVLFLEWEALRSAVAKYLGIEDEMIDNERCHILSVSHDDQEGIEVIQLILPPKDLPKILPCDPK